MIAHLPTCSCGRYAPSALTRREALLRFAGGFGAFILGLFIDLVGFPRLASPGTIPHEPINNLIVLVGTSVFVLSIVAAAILAQLDLSRERHRKILDELRRRRGARVLFDLR